MPFYTPEKFDILSLIRQVELLVSTLLQLHVEYVVIKIDRIWAYYVHDKGLMIHE